MTRTLKQKPFILTVCLNPVIQHTLVLPDLQEDRVNRAREYRIDASGKGINVTRVLARLGERVVHLTHAGGHFCEYFLHLCRNDGLDVRWADSGSEIRTCSTLLNSKNNTSTEIVEEAEPVRPVTGDKIRRLFVTLKDKAGILIISGTKAGGYSDGLYPFMVEQAKKCGMTVILDYRGKDLVNSLPFRPDIIKPNYAEFAATFFPDMTGALQLETATRAKMLQLAGQNITTILTRGSRPVWYTKNAATHEMAVDKIRPINTIGCGDAFTAGLAAGLARHKSWEDALQKAVWCAAQNAQNIRPGAIG